MTDTVSILRKARCDAWWAGLSEEELWEIHDKRKVHAWYKVTEWLREKKAIDISRRALERFEKWMAPQEKERKLAQIVEMRARAAEMSKEMGLRGEIANAFLLMANEVSMRTDDPKLAKTWVDMFAAVIKAEQKDVQLKQHAEDSRLEREKFEAAEKRLAAVREACEGAKAAPGGLTPETLRKIEEAAGLL